MLPGDFTTHPCTEYFSLDLAATFILQEAQVKRKKHEESMMQPSM